MREERKHHISNDSAVKRDYCLIHFINKRSIPSPICTLLTASTKPICKTALLQMWLCNRFTLKIEFFPTFKFQLFHS